MKEKEFPKSIKTRNLTQAGLILLSGRELEKFLRDRERSLRGLLRRFPRLRAYEAELRLVHAYQRIIEKEKSNVQLDFFDKEG